MFPVSKSESKSPLLMQNKKNLLFCIAASFLIHFSFIFCLQTFSSWFAYKTPVEFQGPWVQLIDQKEADEILKTTFEKIEPEKKVTALSPEKEQEAVVDSGLPPFTPPFLNGSFSQEHPYSFSLLKKSLNKDFFQFQEKFDLLSYLPKTVSLPLTRAAFQEKFPLPVEKDFALTELTPPEKKNPKRSVVVFKKLEIEPLLEKKRASSLEPTFSSETNSLLSLSDLQTLSCSDCFDMDLVFYEDREREKYLFALTLIPREDLQLSKLNQSFTFLIDRSNSIREKRLKETKTAVLRALDSLDSEDSFNVIAFDHKMEKMSPHYLPCNKSSQRKAKEFLERIQLGSFFSTSNLSQPLFLTVPSQIDDNEVHTAILLTDGETLSKKRARDSILSEWTAYNQGKVALFAVAMDDPNLQALELITSLNKGKLFFSSNYRGMKRKLLKLLKTIGNPIAKNLSCHAVPLSNQNHIELFPKSTQMPHLYLNQPYVILGETDNLSDFVLFLQAKLNNRWLQIKKKVSFLNAKKASKNLLEDFAYQKAFDCYRKFLIESNPEHLVEAKEILTPYAPHLIQ